MPETDRNRLHVSIVSSNRRDLVNRLSFCQSEQSATVYINKKKSDKKSDKKNNSMRFQFPYIKGIFDRVLANQSHYT